MTTGELRLLPGPVAARHHVTSGGRGDAPVLLFAHGLACDQEGWRDVVPYLAPDHRVVLYDLMGAGRSDTTRYEPGRYTGLGGHADDLLEICQEQGLQDVTVVAHSISTMTAILAAVREPGRFRRLVLIAPSPYFLDDVVTGYHGGFRRDDLAELLLSLDSNYFAWAESMAPVIMGTPDAPEHARRLARSWCSTDPDISRQMFRAAFLADSRPLLPLVTTPSLVLQCRHDAMAPPSVGAYLATHLAGSTLVHLEAVGPCPHVSSPVETATVIRRHLAAVS